MSLPVRALRDFLYGDPGRAVPYLALGAGIGVGLLTRSAGLGLAAALLSDRIWDRMSPRMVIEDPRLGAVTLNCPRRGPCGGKQVWLTFDDGPGPDTMAVLDRLELAQARATFFFIGDNVARYSNLGVLRERLQAGGHRVGNHSFSHPSFLWLESGLARREVERTQDLLNQAFPDSVAPIFRPPFGYRTEDLFAHLQSLGLSVMGWSVNSLDFLSGPPGDVVTRVLERTRPGSILLFHDGPGGRARTLEALPSILSSLKSQGYIFGRPEPEAAL